MSRRCILGKSVPRFNSSTIRAHVPNDRVRAYALWEGWFGYDRKKYASMLQEAFEPFVLCLPRTAEENLLTDSLTDEELKRFPLFAALSLLRPLKI